MVPSRMVPNSSRAVEVGEWGGFSLPVPCFFRKNAVKSNLYTVTCMPTKTSDSVSRHLDT